MQLFTYSVTTVAIQLRFIIECKYLLLDIVSKNALLDVNEAKATEIKGKREAFLDNQAIKHLKPEQKTGIHKFPLANGYGEYNFIFYL